MPVWHASVSAQRKHRPVDDEPRLQRAAVAALRGVGDPDREWWIYGLRLITHPGGFVPMVGHLRVPVTPGEALQIPPGLVLTDAGETGPERARTP